MKIDVARRQVEVDGREIHLTTKEFDLLAHMAASPGRIFTRDQLLARIWGYDYLGDGRTVDVHVSWLRGKLRGERRTQLLPHGARASATPSRRGPRDRPARGRRLRSTRRSAVAATCCSWSTTGFGSCARAADAAALAERGGGDARGHESHRRLRIGTTRRGGPPRDHYARGRHRRGGSRPTWGTRQFSVDAVPLDEVAS